MTWANTIWFWELITTVPNIIDIDVHLKVCFLPGTKSLPIWCMTSTTFALQLLHPQLLSITNPTQKIFNDSISHYCPSSALEEYSLWEDRVHHSRNGSFLKIVSFFFRITACFPEILILDWSRAVKLPSRSKEEILRDISDNTAVGKCPWKILKDHFLCLKWSQLFLVFCEGLGYFICFHFQVSGSSSALHSTCTAKHVSTSLTNITSGESNQTKP